MSEEPSKPEESPWKALGFDTFEAFVKDQHERQERLEKTLEDRKTMIDTQAGEIGTLRKDLKTILESQSQGDRKGATTPTGDDDEGAADDYEKMNLSQLEDILTDDDRQAADEMFAKLEEEQRKLVTQSNESRAEFFREFIRRQDTVPNSLFSKRNAPQVRKEESLKKKIQGLFKSSQPAAGTPAAEQTGIPGLGRTPEERAKAHEAAVQASRASPIILGGDLKGSLERLAKGQ